MIFVVLLQVLSIHKSLLANVTEIDLLLSLCRSFLWKKH